LPIAEAGQLYFIDEPTETLAFAEELGFEIFYANGHTDQMMIPVITYQGKKIAFMADLLPTAGHIPLPYVMGYDTRPLLTMPEKQAFYDFAVRENWFLFMEHDAHNPIINLQDTEKGVRLKDVFALSDVL
jgi:glyoxylase-like metal-dependent hydrolase (beta-lactamase superfamily II)